MNSIILLDKRLYLAHSGSLEAIYEVIMNTTPLKKDEFAYPYYLVDKNGDITGYLKTLSGKISLEVKLGANEETVTETSPRGYVTDQQERLTMTRLPLDNPNRDKYIILEINKDVTPILMTYEIAVQIVNVGVTLDISNHKRSELVM